jgi:hypothetical protein
MENTIKQIINIIDNVNKYEIFEKQEYYIVNVYLPIVYDTFFICDNVNAQFPDVNISYHIPQIIMYENKVYHVDFDVVPEECSFITLKIYKCL